MICRIGLTVKRCAAYPERCGSNLKSKAKQLQIAYKGQKNEKWLKRIGIAVVIILVGLQLIPVNRTNPAITREVKWNAPATRALAQRACYDCHSNETTWPWYGYVAPVSLFLANHIDEGRGRLNFSTWDQPNTELDEVVESINENKMPLWDFLLMHPEAKLTNAEKATLVAGFQATFSQDPPILRPRGSGSD